MRYLSTVCSLQHCTQWTEHMQLYTFTCVHETNVTAPQGMMSGYRAIYGRDEEKCEIYPALFPQGDEG